MGPGHPAATAGPGLARRVLGFCRALRRAGVPVGTDQVLLSLAALEAVDPTRPVDFYWALHAVLVRRVEQRPVFAEVFRRYWRPRTPLPEPLAGLLEASRLAGPPEAPGPAARRARRAVEDAGRTPSDPAEEGGPVGAAWSARERLRTVDFEAMTAEEIDEARRIVASMTIPVRPRPTRRFRPHPRGRRVDLPATLRGALRGGRHDIPLRWRRRVRRPPPVVALVDVSGSMAPYSRVLLHFCHALTRQRPRVHTFVFGTGLTDVTRHLRHRDVDDALARVGRATGDWGAGTRIGAALSRFNRAWARRVLTRGAVVLLLTDGLDRDAGEGLAAEAARLRRSCRRLVWLNPLLRWEGFEPLAAGVRALLPHVHEVRPVHDMASLESLAEALAGPAAG